MPFLAAVSAVTAPVVVMSIPVLVATSRTVMPSPVAAKMLPAVMLTEPAPPFWTASNALPVPLLMMSPPV